MEYPEDDSDLPEEVPEPWRPRFSLRALFLVMLVVCAVGTAASYLARSRQSENRIDSFYFILFTLAGPAILVVVVSLAYQLISSRRK